MVSKIGLMDYSSKLPIRLLLIVLFVPALLWGYGKAIVRMAQINSVDLQTNESNTHDAELADQDNAEFTQTTKKQPRQSTTGPNGLPPEHESPQVKMQRQVECVTDGDSNDSFVSDVYETSAPRNAGSQTAQESEQPAADARLAKRPSTPASTSLPATASAVESSNNAFSPKDGKSAMLDANPTKSTVVEPSGGERTLDLKGENPAERSMPDIEPAGRKETYTNRVLKPISPATSPSNITDSNSNNENADRNGQPSFVGVLGIPTVLFAGLFVVMWGIISGRIQRIMF